jgi:ATP-binding cassette subfamily C protein
VEAVPAFLSGRLIALAIDHGFLRGDALTGIEYLALLGVSVLAGAWGTRQAYQSLAAIVEPFRDELVGLAVRGALRRSAVAAGAPDTAVVARLTQHVEIVREAYASVLMVAQGFVITTVSALIGLFTLLPAALVLVIPPLVLGLVVFFSALGRMAIIQRSSIIADERISESASAMCGGLRDVVACGGEQVVRSMVDRRISEQASATVRLARFSAIRSLAIGIGGLLPIVLILLRAHWLTRHGATTGAILGALTYVLEGVHPTLQTLVRNVGNTGLWLIVTLRRIVEATAAPHALETGTSGVARPAAGMAEEVQLDNVTFAYGSAAEPVIRGLQLVIAAGDHLAIVGPSGAGKSTLANLISGILRPQSGAVWYGSEAVAGLDPRALGRQRVLVPQESYLFSGTLRENLLFYVGDASDSELDRAVAELGAVPLVERIGGYGAQLRVPELSAGERQLLTLVRALLSPAPVVILDEATCHLDPQTESRAEEVFARRGVTLVVVAHRISSAVRAKHIIVLDGVRPVLGTHEQLLISSPLYRDLVGHWGDGTRPVGERVTATV